MGIKQITIIRGSGVKQYQVGCDGVERIEDNSMQWENSIDFIFKVYGRENKLIAEIINCPVDIKYKD